MLPLFALWLPVAAHAEVPLPNYDEEIVIAAWFEVDKAITNACTWPRGGPNAGLPPLACDPNRLDAAIAVATDFLRVVRNDGRLHYLIALAHRHAGRLHQAETALEQAVAVSPDRSEAWRELGELQTLAGQHTQAARSFAEVTRLNPEGPTAWVGWLQRAQTAGHLHDAEAFESHLREALRQGFSFRVIESNPAWRDFYADPVLQRRLERLMGVYGQAETLDSLKPAADP